mmetsp:Transcript_26846/g.76180  ORF Transcript_26846/g.76180 Transcript_26846/m.76180 type:complete len:211 (-) Transcript_26846:75-707(-)
MARWPLAPAPRRCTLGVRQGAATLPASPVWEVRWPRAEAEASPPRRRSARAARRVRCSPVLRRPSSSISSTLRSISRRSSISSSRRSSSSSCRPRSRPGASRRSSACPSRRSAGPSPSPACAPRCRRRSRSRRPTATALRPPSSPTSAAWPRPPRGSRRRCPRSPWPRRPRMSWGTRRCRFSARRASCEDAEASRRRPSRLRSATHRTWH